MESVGSSFKSVDSFKSTTSRDDEVEAVELFDEFWFFQNLFQRKTSMVRSCSDPYPSSKSIEETFEQIQISKQCPSSINTSKEDAFARHNIHRTPSLPPTIGREEVVQEKEPVRRMSKLTRQGSLCSPQVSSSLPPCIEREETIQEKETGCRTSKLSRQASLCSSQRIPSSPPCVGREEVVQEKETVHRMSKLTRQASLSSSNVSTTPRTPKAVTPSPGILKNQARKERIDNNKDRRKSPLSTNEVMRRSLSYNMTSKSLSKSMSLKSRSELECEEVQGFKDLGFVFDKEVLNPSVLNIIPGLQSNKPVDQDNDNARRKPYLSEAWLVQRSTPTVPDWLDRRSAVDMKAQLKFWARAVASNAQQEC